MILLPLACSTGGKAPPRRIYCTTTGYPRINSFSVSNQELVASVDAGIANWEILRF